ncbi:fatty acid-binding protein, brain-like isoform X2 [Pomacea canaliculata]|uniref:fatty acid-binding protein, brain-like isoform X2 n=1 Tax=Pomacea canaliculata TaxID=400727 RepID=UPI000D72F59C|nr:fatty acid-binding protein, brain-like isoform X2 [Pomacea canaliculata]
MTSPLIGYWKLESNGNNWDEYLKTAGVGIVLRKVGNTITSYEEISVDGDEWTIAITSSFKNSLLKFKLDQEFPEETMDGRKVSSVMTLDGDKLVHKQRALKNGEIDSLIIREVKDGRLNVVS